MDYQIYNPHRDLKTVVKCYWTLEIPKQKDTQRQLILPDGCVDMCFILGDDIKRYTSDREFLIQPRQMLLGQITEPFYIEPTGYVNTFAVRFYPYGFANFVSTPINKLANNETPLATLFGEKASADLSAKILAAPDIQNAIAIVEEFLLNRLKDKATIDTIVKS